VKSVIQHIVRRAHLALAPIDLPTAIGVYFHALEPADHPKFAALVRELRATGYRLTGDPSDYLTARDKVAWLSFDDNYRSWHSSKELLDQLEVKATFYVNTLPLRGVASATDTNIYFDRIDHRGERLALSASELGDLAATGHEIGAHTHTHRNLGRLTKEAALADIAENLDQLRRIVGKPVEHFAFPFGLPRHFPRGLVAGCEQLQIRTIAYAAPGMQYAPRDPLALQRTPWRFSMDARRNWDDLRVDGRTFINLTGRSSVG
jgi:peptidoglycan/xylan/chitin deacetylase (PgdA/CDA1 family)